jgi:FlaA1/EpsC-like NDP-sugar epimerase
VRKKITNLYVLIHALGDLLILNISYVIGNFLGFNFKILQMFDTKYLQLWIYLNIIYLFAAQLSGTFDMYRNTRFFTLLSALFRLFFFQVLLAFSYIVVFKDFNETFRLSREVLLITYTTAFLLTTIWRFGFIKVVRLYRARGFNNRKVMIIGAGETAQEFKAMLEHKIEYGYHFLGFFDDEPQKYSANVQKHIIGNVAYAKQYAIENFVLYHIKKRAELKILLNLEMKI